MDKPSIATSVSDYFIFCDKTDDGRSIYFWEEYNHDDITVHISCIHDNSRNRHGADGSVYDGQTRDIKSEN